MSHQEILDEEIEKIAKLDLTIPINIILKIAPENYYLINGACNKDLNLIVQKIDLMKGPEEKLKFLTDEINRKKRDLTDEWLALNTILNLPIKEATNQSMFLGGAVSKIKAAINDKTKTGFMGIQQVYPTQEQVNDNIQLVERLDKLFISCGIYDKSSPIDEESRKTLFKFCVYTYCYTQLSKNLCKIYDGVQNGSYAGSVSENINIIENTTDKSINKDFTTARQVLAMHYILDQLNVYNNTDKTQIAKFIQFLTGKELGVKKISDTSIYKKLKKPISKTDKQVENDLIYIRPFFEKLGLKAITDKINKEIGSKA